MNRNIASGIVPVLLLIWVCTVAARKGLDLLLPHRSAEQTTDERVASQWQELISGRIPVLGTPVAKFKIVEFSDYQCPFCATIDPGLSRFIAHHSGDAVVFRYDMPLQTIHRYAYAAALAAGCAELQGIRAPYQSLLFQHQKEFATLNWIALAKQSGITNGNSFAQCVREETPRGRIHKDIEKAESIGITGTPTFIINGTLSSGILSEDRLEYLYRAMNEKPRGFLRGVFTLFKK